MPMAVPSDPAAHEGPTEPAESTAPLDGAEETNVVVVIPTLNEGDTIRALIERLRAMRTMGVIVVVDDGSTDGTLDG